LTTHTMGRVNKYVLRHPTRRQQCAIVSLHM
jgi:hypothetical protein